MLFVVVCCCLLFVVVRCCPLLIVVDRCSLMFVVVRRLLSLLLLLVLLLLLFAGVVVDDDDVVVVFVVDAGFCDGVYVHYQRTMQLCTVNETEGPVPAHLPLPGSSRRQTVKTVRHREPKHGTAEVRKMPQITGKPPTQHMNFRNIRQVRRARGTNFQISKSEQHQVFHVENVWNSPKASVYPSHSSAIVPASRETSTVVVAVAIVLARTFHGTLSSNLMGQCLCAGSYPLDWTPSWTTSHT